MVIDNTTFQPLFYELQICHSLIHKLDISHDKDHPIQELSEAFSLCSGAFSHLCEYHYNYSDLFDNSKNENKESWNILSKTPNFQTFLKEFLPPSKIIQLDFRSMCIANAAFRLSAAGVLLCDVIQKISLNKCEIEKSKWQYQTYFNQSNRDWNRKKIYPKNPRIGDCVDKTHTTSHRCLSLILALRDEYGHSEFADRYKCREDLRKKYYRDYIINAEIDMLQNCVALIRHLCEIHYKKLIKV